MLQEYFFLETSLYTRYRQTDGQSDGWMDGWMHFKPKKPHHKNIHFHRFFPAGVIVENDTQLQNNQLFTL